MRLALAFREPNVVALQDRIDSAEFSEWLAYERLAPLAPDERLHELLATLCAIFASVHRAKNARAYGAEDFMPWREVRSGRPRLTGMERDLKEHIVAVGKAAAKKPKGRRP